MTWTGVNYPTQQKKESQIRYSRERSRVSQEEERKVWGSKYVVGDYPS